MSGTPPTLIHVGLHKTGTTWLQHNVFRPGQDRLWVYTEDRAILRGNTVVPAYGTFDLEAAAKDFEPLEARARNLNGPLILSDEMLGGLAFGSRHTRKISFQRIDALFPHGKVLVTIREQRAVVLSAYGHYLRGGGTATLGTFLSQPEPAKSRLWEPILDLAAYDYDALYDLCADIFGADRFRIAPMEDMLRRGEGFVAELLDWIGVPAGERGTADASKVTNPAWSPQAYGMLRLANMAHVNRANWEHKRRPSPNYLASLTDRFVPARLSKKAKARQKAIVADHVTGVFDASNGRLSQKLGLDLAALGYVGGQSA